MMEQKRFVIVRHPFTNARFMIHNSTCSRARTGDWYGPFLNITAAERECEQIARMVYGPVKISYCKRCKPRGAGLPQ